MVEEKLLAVYRDACARLKDLTSRFDEGGDSPDKIVHDSLIDFTIGCISFNDLQVSITVQYEPDCDDADARESALCQVAKVEAIARALMKHDVDPPSMEPNSPYDKGQTLLKNIAKLKDALTKTERPSGMGSKG